MLKTLKQFFEKHVEAGFKVQDTASLEHSIRLAGAVILVETAMADFEFDRSERKAIAAALKTAHLVSEDEAHELLHLAEVEVDASVSLHEFINVLNRNLNPDQKRVIMEMLWEVAYADGRIDKYEDYRIRKLADLLHVPHKHFIQAKLKIEQKRSG
jgi:uncharacterized tellurite resistance protein B-like protein